MAKTPIDFILSKLSGVAPSGDGYTAICPAHDDKNPSLSIAEGDDGRVLLTCHAGCNFHDIYKAMGVKMDDLFPSKVRYNPRKKREVASYSYIDRKGALRHETVRYEPKAFRQRRPGEGEWIYNLKGVKRILYKLQELSAASPETWVFIVEGEKDVDNLVKAGLIATTCSGGANKWHLTNDRPLCGRRVVILPDNDPAGKKHAQQVAKKLHGKAKEVKIIELPELGPKEDVTDWLNKGGTAEKLVKMADAASLFDPKAVVESLSNDTTDEDTLVLDPQDPLPSARAFLEEIHLSEEPKNLIYFAKMFYIWHNWCYRRLEIDALRQKLYRFLEKAKCFKKDNLVPFKPHKIKVAYVLDALQSEILHPEDNPPPIWLDGVGDRPNPIDILPTKGKLVDLGSGDVLDSTPLFFSTYVLDFEYKPDAPKPEEWSNFLRSLWGDDEEAINLLQEWFGYCLTPDTRQHKMLMLVGPKRAGKGTIGRVLTGILGEQNVAGPTLSDLASNFGLWPLIGKPLAIIPDARLSARQNLAQITERLLAISGEDYLTIDRKHQEQVTLKLKTRIMLITNELPWLGDSSGALANRFLILNFTESFFGKENINLTDMLMRDLPGILLWAIEGRRRLLERGFFVQPKSAEQDLEALEDLSSPIRVYVRERLIIGPGHTIAIGAVYQDYRDWCQEDEYRRPSRREVFCRDLRAVLPKKIGVIHRRAKEKRFRVYKGIGLKDGPAGEF